MTIFAVGVVKSKENELLLHRGKIHWNGARQTRKSFISATEADRYCRRVVKRYRRLRSAYVRVKTEEIQKEVREQRKHLDQSALQESWSQDTELGENMEWYHEI